MPVIPGSNDPQVLNASSPVPIASGSKATVMAGAFSQFGDAVAKIGETLGHSQKQAYAQKQRLDVEESTNKFAEELALAEMRQANSPLIEDDIDGTKTFSAFKESMRDPMSRMAEGIENPETRREFMAKAEQQLQVAGLRIYKANTERRVIQNDQQIGRVINQYVNGARMGGSVDDAMAKAEILIRGDADLLPDAKEARIVQARKDIVWGAFSGEIDRGMKNGNFEGAKRMLSERGDVFDVKDQITRQNEIETAENRYYQMETQKATREDRAAEKQAKKASDAALQEYSTVVQRGDPQEILVARAELEASVSAGLVDPIKADRMMNNTAAKSRMTDAFRAILVQQLVEGADPASVQGQVESMAGTKLMDEDKVNLRMGLGAVATKMQDPTFAAQVKEAVGMIEQSEPMRGMSPAKQHQFLVNKGAMKTQFYAALATNLQGSSPISIAQGVMTLKGAESAGSGVRDVSIIQSEMDSIVAILRASPGMAGSNKAEYLKYQTQLLKLRAEKDRAAKVKGN